ncbi:AMP-binding protein [Kitasatospora sp. NPDC004272]
MTGSLLDGGPAVPPGLDTLGEALLRAARSDGPEGIQFVHQDGTESSLGYRELLDNAARILAGLRAGGARPGQTVVLQVGRDPELLAAFWACVLGGFVPMPVSAAAADAPSLLHRVWQGYGRPWVVTGSGQPVAAETVADPGWAGALLGDTRALLGHAPDRSWHRAAPEDTAVLLLTSGSTGVPKAVVLTHRNILSRSAATALANRLGRATRSFNWMALDHVGGLVMFHVRDVFLGCHQVHARTAWVLADPLRWLDAVHRHRIDTTWAPNFAFGLINDRAERLAGRDWDLSCLRYIMNGGEAIRGRVVRRFLELLAPFGLPGDAMHPGWGMSETSAGVVDCEFTAVTAAGADDRHVPAGRPQPGTAVRVVDDAGEPVPEGTLGRLQAGGASITGGYFRNPAQNRQSFTPDGWFKTGDLARIEGGVLTVTGRADDLIQLGEVTCYGHEIEAAVEELDFVEPSFTVACLVDDDQLAVFYHPRAVAPGGDPARAVRARVAERLGVEPTHVLAVAREEIPKTGIGKLRRAQLRDRFEALRTA